MPLRCLLFSTDEGLAPPIWQVLADLGIEGEYCGNAVEAVERVTTQLFQIVITDWDDQPEAEFLLKTSRELKAAHRPLTLAIVTDDAHLPLALRAGANSILRKPLSLEQARDTLSTARDLLRAKVESSAPAARQAAATAAAAAFAAAASAAPAVPGAPGFAPASVTNAPENAFRKGEFLQPASSDPGRQFDTGTESEAAKSAEEAAAAEVDPLTELEPMAAAVEAAPEEPPQQEEEEVTGWSAVKARLAKLSQEPAPPPPSAKPQLLSYEDTSSHPATAGPTEEANPDQSNPDQSRTEKPPVETKAEAQLFAYIAGESTEESEPEVANAPNRLVRLLVAGALAAAVVVAVVEIPGARHGAGKLYASVVHAGKSWLNPPIAAPPQAPTQHESFGQADDEYKLPVAGNIADATTDPSQIRVLPVVDPTAKPANGAAANSGQVQPPATPGDSGPANQNQTGQVQVTEQTAQNPAVTVQPAADPFTAPAGSATVPAAAVPQVQTNLPAPVESSSPRPVPPPVQSASQPRPVSVASSAIPSSLKSQIASSTPEASGTKPADAALPSIQPVDLPESAARGLLLQQVEPVYPDAAKNSHQQGSVVLQVLIAADGSVQDAKFLQGSLVFARAAIDAVRQWRFKPYLFNGRATSVQTVLSLHFLPPAS
ncbi:MAG: TonB family protein [Candidatus Sulfotelmatobacter sp.]